MFTILITDIEGSTGLWQQYPQQMKASLEVHDGIMKSVIRKQGGKLVKSTGDGVMAIFDAITTSAFAAVEIQKSLEQQAWGETGPLRVRMGLHTGEVEERDGDVFGTSVNKSSRIMSLASGGQILLSETTAALLRENSLDHLSLVEMGKYRLKGLPGQSTVYQLNHPDLLREFPPLRGADESPNNLPVGLASFIGRQKELTHITNLLVDTAENEQRVRFVTLAGPGGTGKTRLSIEAGKKVRQAFPDGVWIIELAPLSEAEKIPYALAEVFHLQESAGVPLREMLTQYLSGRQLLLIFDNCEHLIEASAGWIEHFLQHCPMVQVLASSRESLGVYGEQVVRIPSLPLPPDNTSDWDVVSQSESVQLMMERARSANAQVILTEDNRLAVAQICRRLDGIPLAIELAAARLVIFTPVQILQRLDDRFRLLTGGSRTALPRQQTLKALIDWSYEILSEEEKNLLMDLSVFRGGWTVDAALEISPELDIFTLLPQLVNKSLVVVEPGEKEMRYQFLETIRQYARDRLLESGRAHQVRTRHLTYFLDFSNPPTQGGLENQNKFYNRCIVNIDNIRGALAWAKEHDPVSAGELAGKLFMFWTYSGLWNEARELLSAIRSELDDIPVNVHDTRYKTAYAHVLLALASINGIMGESSRAIDEGEKAISLYHEVGDKDFLPWTLLTYAVNAFHQQKIELMLSALDEADELGKQTGQDVIISGVLICRSLVVLAVERDLDKARSLANQAFSISPGWGTFSAGIQFMIQMEITSGNWDEARCWVDRGIELAIQAGHPPNHHFFSMFENHRGHIERKSGNLEAAEHIYKRTIQVFFDRHNQAAACNILECFAFIAVQKGRGERAARLFGAAESIRTRIEETMTPVEQIEYVGFVEQLRGVMPVEELEKEWAEGKKLSLAEAVRYAQDYAEI